MNQPQSYFILWLKRVSQLLGLSLFIQMIFKFGERRSPWIYMTIILGTIFGKLCGFVLEKIIRWWAELKGVRATWQACFRKGKSTLDHILTSRTLIEQEVFVGRCLILGLLILKKKKTFDTILCDKLWECLQWLGVAPHLQQVVKAMYTVVYAKFE